MKKTLKRLGAFSFAIALLATLAACGAKKPAEAPAAPGDATTDHLTIAMCLELPNIDFYTASKAGGIDAAAADGNAKIITGSEDVSELLSIIETQIDAGVDGICIQASNPDSLKNVIDKADKKGIPCIVFNNTMEYDGFDGCVGMDPLVAGAGIGEKIELILSGADDWSAKLGIAKDTVPQGKIAFFLDSPGAYNLEGRREGVLNVLNKYDGIEDVGVYDITSQGIAYAMEVVQNVITANPDIKVLCSVCSDGTAAAALAVQNLGLEEQILVIGMDTNETTLNLVKEGVLPCAFNQNPYDQGYIPVEQIIKNIREGIEIPPVTSTELVTIYADGVDSFLELEQSFKTTVANFKG